MMSWGNGGKVGKGLDYDAYSKLMDAKSDRGRKRIVDECTNLIAFKVWVFDSTYIRHSINNSVCDKLLHESYR